TVSGTTPLNRGVSEDRRDHTVLRTGPTIRAPNEFPDQHAAVNVRTIRTRHPAAPSARTQVAAVAPVVTTSSSSTTELPAGGRPLRTVLTRPARLRARCSRPISVMSRAPPPNRSAGATAAGYPDRVSPRAHHSASVRV